MTEKDCVERGDGNPQIDLLGLKFDGGPVSVAVATLLEFARRREPVPVRLVNSFSVTTADANRGYRNVLEGRGINFVDGMPLALLIGLTARVTVSAWRVRGPTLFEETLRATTDGSVRHLFFGGSAATARQLADVVQSEFPGTVVTASVSPPMADETTLTELAVSAYDLHGGDIVWLGLGTPKQDFIARDLSMKIGRPCVGIGAAFDFMAGTARAAPLWVQRAGLEWAYRFVTEPRRLWRRYTIGLVHFGIIVLADLLSRLSQKRRSSAGVQQGDGGARQ